ncbi:hypothetical protein TCAL_14796 [Tigriopus californicus]|uniref:BTB domain-containing protein n=1 Tax=Tigriopus californicus TaxID=6832 RepID=A0A553PNN0_TIGCA|nr:hypothetical protein TCAL_14796 [Tigriopus californicus]
MTSLTCMSRAFAGFNRDRLMDVFTDVTFRIANTGETLGAHSAVLGSLSPWIAQYRDQITCSCSSKPCCHDKPHLDIVLVGYDAFTVEKMLETVYTGQAQVNVATATAIEQLGSSLGLRLAASLYPDEALRVSTPGQEPRESGSVAIRPLIKGPEYEIKMETDPLAMTGVDIDESESYSSNPKKSGLRCFKCQEVHKSSTKLKFHLCRTHFKTALIEKCQGNTGECDICGYLFADVASTAMHLGLKHDKIRDFVSKDDQPEIYSDQEKNVSLQSMIFEDEQFALSMLRKTLNQTNHPMVSEK